MCFVPFPVRHIIHTHQGTSPATQKGNQMQYVVQGTNTHSVHATRQGAVSAACKLIAANHTAVALSTQYGQQLLCVGPAGFVCTLHPRWQAQVARAQIARAQGKGWQGGK